MMPYQGHRSNGDVLAGVEERWGHAEGKFGWSEDPALENRDLSEATE